MLDLSPASSFELPSRSNTGFVCLPQIPGDSYASKDLLRHGDSFTHVGWGWASPRSQPSLSSFLNGPAAALRATPSLWYYLLGPCPPTTGCRCAEKLGEGGEM